ncbi:hypothetical protein [Cellulosimicrobium sp. CUA-896]|uniref:hypothetical protein n=1 Tax=Cellulosimicrobium sp. CUA-896 TaxID=1517881 RepID=UPI0009652937|nr:hypothetical protein [Cellulosimicrobium sp. CUA-896]OLT54566.1 hypothetical protein BJF88_08605 [Cellulosimicrobium sp. CUA-896]
MTHNDTSSTPAASSAAPTDVTRIVVRPIGSPLPLGFLGLAVATTAFAALQLGWLPPSEGRVVALGVLAITVPAQLLAAVYGFLARDPVAGTGTAILAGTWAAAGTATLVTPPGASSPGLGVLLVASAAVMLVPAAAASTGKLVAAGVMGLTALRFAVTGVAEITGAPGWLTAAGVVGLTLAVAALYAALALELEGAGTPVLPVLRRGSGQDADTGDLDSALRGLAREAGVRRQL